MRCEKCKSDNDEGAKFCSECGSSVSVAPEEVSTKEKRENKKWFNKRISLGFSGVVWILSFIVVWSNLDCVNESKKN